jgi:hypothetical protein
MDRSKPLIWLLVGAALANIPAWVPTMRDTPLRRAKGSARYGHTVGYKPHQGEKECARRVRQMSGEKLPSVPRRLWFAFKTSDVSRSRRVGDISNRRSDAIRSLRQKFRCSKSAISAVIF